MLDRLKQFFNRVSNPGGASGRHAADVVREANRWRDQLNPLRGLTIKRAISLRDAWQRGELADIQWTYNAIERSDADLFALIERRKSAISQLDWNIKTVGEDRHSGFDQALADEQTRALRQAYERIENLRETVEHLTTATFRGFAHLEKHRDDSGAVTAFEPCDQWNLVRDGWYGGWKLNPRADSVAFAGLPAENLIAPEEWIIRTVPRHIDWLGLIKQVRQALVEKDWDAFCEIYGIPGAVVFGPPNVPNGKETVYEEAARAVADGGSGYLPYGSDVKFPTEARGQNPFRARLDYLSEKLILAGTGGLLTMLTAPTGIGKGPSEQHADVFAQIAHAEAMAISEVLQRQFDREILAAQFPGKPVLAYWELAANEETDVGQVVEHASKLKAAGYRIGIEELSEKTGYELEETNDAQGNVAGDPGGDGTAAAGDAAQRAQAGQDGAGEKDSKDGKDARDKRRISNRAVMTEADAVRGVDRLARAFAEDLQPLRTRLERILQIADPEIMRNRLAALQAELPQILADINADPEAAKILGDEMSSAMAAGAASRPMKNRAVLGDVIENGRMGQPRDSLGRWVDENGGGLSDEDNLARGNNAIDRALRRKRDVQKAMYRRDMGQIDFLWGSPGDKAPDAAGRTRSGGFGISHVVAKHGESAARELPKVLAKGIATAQDDQKRIIEHDEHRAVLVKENSRKAWVLTGYDRRQVIR